MTVFAKILLYNLSLVPLYFLFIIKKIDLSGINDIFNSYSNIDNYKAFITDNTICFLLLVLIIISILAFKKFIRETKSGKGIPKNFNKIRNIDFNHLTFIATYILPLLAFTLDGIRDMIFITFLLVFIGIIYIKTNLYYLSPVFIIFGIKVYSSEEKGGSLIILLSKYSLNNSESLYYTKIGDIYFIKGKNEQ